jgi:hypothetical protein
MLCTSPSSRHFIAPPALVSDPLFGILVVRIAPCRVWSSLASGNNASNIGHANSLVVRCRGVWPDRFVFHGHDLGRCGTKSIPATCVGLTLDRTSGSCEKAGAMRYDSVAALHFRGAVQEESPN